MYRKRSRASKNREARNFRPRFEPLEQRMLLSISMTQWSTQDIVYTTTNTSSNWYTDTRELQVTFTPPAQSGLSNIVAKGFWDGDNAFKVRFTPTTTGTWTYSTTTGSTITGLTNQTEAGGSQIVVGSPLSGDHGFLRVDPQHQNSFVWDDGTRFFLWGQTYYDIVSHGLSNETWKTAIDNTAAYGMTKVIIEVYTDNYGGAAMHHDYPDTQPYNGTTSTPNRDSLNLEYWQKLDEIVEYLDTKGLVADLVVTDAYSKNRMFGTDDQNSRYIEYVAARYAAYDNVMWDVCYEFDKSPTAGGTNPQDKDDFNRMGAFLRGSDPWMDSGTALRPISIHPEGGRIDFRFFDQTWPTHVILQYGGWNEKDPGGGGGTYTNGDQWGNAGSVYNAGHDMPVVNDEYGYIGQTVTANGTTITMTQAQLRSAIWGIAVGGGYGTAGDWRTITDGTATYKPAETGDWVDAPGEYGDISRLVNYFTTKGIEYWKMTGHNELTTQSRTYVLAEPGRQYVVYKATGGNYSLTLASGTYNVWRYDPTTGAETSLGTVTGTGGTYTSSGQPTGHDYVYRLISTRPSAAGGLSATSASSTQINLSWTDDSNNETAFEIDRATNSSFTSGLVTVTVAANITSYPSTGLSASTTYYYRVRATIGGTNDSTNSNTANATTTSPPVTPTGLSAVLASATHVNLSWTDTSSNETGFEIDRATNSSFTSGLVTATVTANVATYQSSGLTPDTTYYYRVRSTIGGTNDSGNSNTVSATTTIVDVTWTGANGSTWSTVANSGNWKKTSDGTTANYIDTANVTFDDTAAGSSVNIGAGSVAPASVTFNNGNVNFVITGTHGIAGAVTTVIKQGVGTVVMASANSYGGVTTIEGGTLVLQGMTAAMVPVLENAGADIRGGMLMLDYAGGTSPATLVQQLMAESFHAGAFDTGKFQSSASTIALGLGWIDNTAARKISVVYTLYGDATLDGVVDFSDLGKVLAHYNQPGVWADGDFNYDGVVNFSDLGKILANYNKSLTSMGLRIASNNVISESMLLMEQSAADSQSLAADAAITPINAVTTDVGASVGIEESPESPVTILAKPASTGRISGRAFAGERPHHGAVFSRAAVAAALHHLDLSSQLSGGSVTSDEVAGSTVAAAGSAWHRNAKRAAVEAVFRT